MSATYKAVFTCEATNERVVWYVSNHLEGRRHLRDQLSNSGKKPKAVYRKNEWNYTCTPVFGSDLDVHYDVVNSWSGS